MALLYYLREWLERTWFSDDSCSNGRLRLSETSIDGNSFFGNLHFETTIGSGVATLKAGNISLTSDINEDGTLIFGQNSQDTYVVAANGRATTGSGNTVIYIISPTKFLILDVNPTNPASITVAEQ